MRYTERAKQELDLRQTIKEKNSKLNMLAGLDEVRAQHVAMALENHKRANGNCEDSTWKRVSLALVRRIMGATNLFDLVDVQVLSEPNGVFLTAENGEVKDEAISTGYGVRRAKWSKSDSPNAEYELAVILAQEIVLEEERAIICDMRLTGSHHKFNLLTLTGDTMKLRFEDFFQKLKDLAVSLPGKPWIIGPPEMTYHLELDEVNNADLNNSLGIFKAGTKDGFTIFRDPLFIPNYVLIGTKMPPHQGPFVWCPYTIMELQSIGNILGYRRAKRLRPDGGNQFINVKLENYCC